MDLKEIAATAGRIAEKVMEVAEVVGPLIPGGTPIVTAVKMIATIGTGLVKAEPAAEALFAEIKAAAEGGAAPSDEQWAAWQARVDQAHDDLTSALASS